MVIGSILLVLALLILVGLFVSRPFFELSPNSSDRAGDIADHDRSALLAERDRILNALQELDFDHTLGKIPAEDYPQQRAVLLQRGGDILRQLDALDAEVGQGDDVEARLEATIAMRRADAQNAPGQGGEPGVARTAPVIAPDDDLEVMIAKRRRSRQEKAVGFCPKCGGPLQKSDHFCPKCGAKLV